MLAIRRHVRAAGIALGILMLGMVLGVIAVRWRDWSTHRQMDEKEFHDLIGLINYNIVQGRIEVPKPPAPAQPTP